MIIPRYLTREVLFNTLLVTLVLLFVFASNQVVHFLADVAKGQYPLSMAFHLMLLQMPLLLGYFLPLGLFLGILISYGRLYVNNEATVLFSCGWSSHQLLALTLGIGGAIFLLTAFFTLWVKPELEWSLERLRAQAVAVSPIELLTPGRFQAIRKGELVIYVASLSKDHQKMKHVFLARKANTPRASWEVISANSGYQQVEKDSHNKFLILEQGAYYSGVPGEIQYQIVSFKQLGLNLHQDLNNMPKKNRLLKMVQLWKLRDRPEQAAELQWRLAVPLSVLPLSVLAIPMSRVNPRQGNFAKLVPALLWYMVYVNGLFIGKVLLSKGLMPLAWGLWWVHGIMLAIALKLFYQPLRAE